MPALAQDKNKQQPKSLWSRLKLLDNYRWATLLALGISPFLLISLIAAHGFFDAAWFFEILISFNFLNSPVSSSGYIATIVKGFVTKPAPTSRHNIQPANENHVNSSVELTLFNLNGVPVTRPLPKYEKHGTLIGATVGVLAAIALFVFHETIPFFKTFSYFADCLFSFTTIGSFASLGNRLGSCGDSKGSRLPSEKAFIGTAAGIGFVLGLAIVLCKVVATVAFASAATIATGGAALPLVLAGIITVSGCTSTMASAGDYLSKAVNFARVKLFNNNDAELTKQVNDRPHEYRGATVGVSLGLVVGIAIACLIPHVFMAVAAIAVVIACVSAFGSLCSRIGRFWDGFNKCKKEAAEIQEAVAPAEHQIEPEQQPEPPTETATPTPSPESSITTPAAVQQQSPTPVAQPIPQPITTFDNSADVIHVKVKPNLQRDQQSVRALTTSPSLSPSFFNKRESKKDIAHDYQRFVKTHIASNAATAPRLSMAAAAAA